MAIYSVQLKSLSRGKGHSATAAASYRAGLALGDPTTGELHDYTRRAGVVAVDMLAPSGAPAWALDPHQLWGRVELHETRKNARVGREIVLALPHELGPEARRALACEVGQLLVDRYQVAVQVALHAPDKGGDERNFHAHLLFTPRQVGPEGFGAYSAKVLDEFPAGAAEIKAVRAAVADCINRALERRGVAGRVDPRRLEEQKLDAAGRGDFQAAAQLDRLPTKHEGKATTQARRRGERLPRARRNDRRQAANKSHLQAQADRLRELKAQAAAEGRLAHVDEQALHAQALLDVAHAKARTRQAAYLTPNRSNAHGPRRHLAPAIKPNSVHSRGDAAGRYPRGLQPLPAVRALDRAAAFGQVGGHAGRPGGFAAFVRPLLLKDAPRHHDADSSLQRIQPGSGGVGLPKPKRAPAPRRVRPTAPTSSRTRITGDGSRESERVAQLANVWLASLEDSIAKLIRQALAWGQQHTDPVPRSLAKNYLNAEGEAQVAACAHEHITEQLEAARRQRGDLAKRVKAGPGGLKGLDKFTAALGWAPKSLRDLHEAHKHSQELVVMAKETEQHTADARRRAKAEAELHRQRLLAAYEKAHPPTGPRFRSRERTTTEPAPGVAATPGPHASRGCGSPSTTPPRPWARGPR